MNQYIEFVKENLLLIYLVGIVAIGLPMAITGLWIFLQGYELDRGGWKNLFLKAVRNFLFPGSFLLNEDREPRGNHAMSYEGPINMIFDLDNTYGNYGGRRVVYVLVSSMLWPIRLLISLFFTALTVGLSGVCMVVFGPFWLLCKSIGRLFEEKKRW
ncbi:MAG: hypothetical protein RJB39_505 [Candidatus Parcubacteria bacterium]|jgi:hypothetical protein